MAFTEEKGGNARDQDLYQVQTAILDSQQWQIFNFTDWLGDKGMVSPLGFYDGSILYNQVVFDKGLYYGKVLMNKGSKVDEVKIPYFRNKAPLQSGCLSRDGQYMILSMEGNNTYGVEDLYVVKRKADGSWEQAKNLGYMLGVAKISVEEYAWYAPGIGFVKSVRKENSNNLLVGSGEASGQLTSFKK